MRRFENNKVLIGNYKTFQNELVSSKFYLNSCLKGFSFLVGFNIYCFKQMFDRVSSNVNIEEKPCQLSPGRELRF